MDVYTVVEGETRSEDYWLRIGRCFPHKNGDGGFNLLLNALPLNGKLVVKSRTKREKTELGAHDRTREETVEM